MPVEAAPVPSEDELLVARTALSSFLFFFFPLLFPLRIHRLAFRLCLRQDKAEAILQAATRFHDAACARSALCEPVLAFQSDSAAVLGQTLDDLRLADKQAMGAAQAYVDRAYAEAVADLMGEDSVEGMAAAAEA